MQTFRGNWSAGFTTLRNPRVFFQPVELSIQALGPLSSRFQWRTSEFALLLGLGRFNYSFPASIPVSSFVYSFCWTRRKPRRIPLRCSFSPFALFFPFLFVAEVIQDQPRETYSVLLPLCLLFFSRFPLVFSGPALRPSYPLSKRQTNRSCCSLNEKCFYRVSSMMVLHRTSATINSFRLYWMLEGRET